MHIASVTIKNIRSIKSATIDFKDNPTDYSGWHVLLGSNGSGKSTLIKAIALALIGPEEAWALRENWSNWLSQNESSGYVRLDIKKHDIFDKRKGRGTSLKKYFIPLYINITKINTEGEFPTTKIKDKKIGGISGNDYTWGGKGGWFSAAYGPYRRLSGGDKDYDKLYYSNPKLSSHLSAFKEDVALSESLSWLISQHIRSIEQRITNPTVEKIKSFINNSDLLPHNVKLHAVTGHGLEFIENNHKIIPIESLSDGFRSIICLAIDLLRHMIRSFGHAIVFSNATEENSTINIPGVVIIDEIDAHLHPSWQVVVGEWFTKHFPQIQFIVTTHSPLICHAATKGCIWQLSNPNADFEIKKLSPEEKNRLVYGDIQEAYSTNLFGTGVSVSKHGLKMQERIAELNIKLFTEGLSPEESREYKQLGKIFPSSVDQGL